MNLTFNPLHPSHFPLLLKWLETPHIKKWWDQEVIYTPNLVKEKYGDYVKGYKQIDGINKPIKAYIICMNDCPIGYIQLYNAYDFPRDKKLTDLPKNLGTFDIFIGDEKYLGQNIGSQAIEKFLSLYTNNYSYLFVDPYLGNIAAIKAYDKAGFKAIRVLSKERSVWMLKCKEVSFNKNLTPILNQLAMREPIFHHPDKFGKTEQDIEDQMCEEFWEVGASGSAYSKQDVIEALLERYNDSGYQDIWETSDFKLTQIAPDNYLLTYNLIQNKTRRTRRSTIWRKVNGQWKILYHQGTIAQE